MELFEWLSRQCLDYKRSWDCATGSGQAAVSLAEHFDEVIATDVSEEQIRNSYPHPRITYRIARAEDSGIERSSVDLITVATALHWFDQPKFFVEVERVLKPGGVLAVWSYAGTRATKELDEVLDTFAFETLRDYWPEGAKKNWMGRYRDVVLPYPAIESPQFYGREHWTLEQLLAYLNSWSAVQNYLGQNGRNPVDTVQADLKNNWNADERQEFRWELWLKVGRKPVLSP